MQLLEREGARAALAGALTDAERGSGRCVFVAGEAGIGKTSLLRHFETWANITASWGYCDSLFTPRPFGPVRDLAPFFGPEVVTALESGARERLFDQVLAALDGTESPKVVVLEDLHWADEPTLDLLVFLARRIHDRRALIVGTYRDDELSPGHPLRVALGRIATSPSIRHIELVPLSVDAVARLTSGGRADPARIHAETSGNPFLVTQLLEAPPGTVPRGVDDATRARIAGLSGEAADILMTGALAGNRIELEVLLSVCSPSDDAMLEATSAGLARIEGARLVFRHELVRRALERLADPARARAAHRALVIALEGRGESDAARLAYHAEGSDDAERAVKWARAAADAAVAAGGHREAAAQYARILRFPQAITPQERAYYLQRRAHECYLTDSPAEALANASAALDAWRTLGDRLQEGDCLRALSRYAWYSGDRERADQAADEGIAALEEFPPGRELAMAYSNRSQLYMLQSSYRRSLEWAERAIALAKKLGDVEVLVHALNNVGISQAELHDPSGYTNMEQSLQLALQHGLGEHVARAYINLGRSALYAADYGRARRYLEEGFVYCRDRDLDSFGLYNSAIRGRLLLEQAQWDAALEVVEWMLFERQVGAATTRSFALVVMGLIDARRGGLDPSLLDEALALAIPTGEPDRIAYVRTACAEAALLRGDRTRALEEVRAGFEIANQAESASARGLSSLWTARLGEEPPRTGHVIEPIRLELAEQFEAAARAWADTGCLYDAAWCLARVDDPDAARSAAQILLSLRATAAWTTIDKVRRKMGLTGLPRGPRQATATNPVGLTPREQEIVELLAEGLRNREIAEHLVLSEKTVHHHVSAVLRKLGVSSRGAAVARARELASD